MNNFKSPIVEFHIIQSFPVSCLNRDDTNSPKTALVGGVIRARVSSQSWKRATRETMHELGQPASFRTKNTDTILENKILAKGADPDVAKACASHIASLISEDSLTFLADKEYDALVEHWSKTDFEFDEKSKEDLRVIKKILTDTIDSGLNAVDIALFGRMIAKINSVNVEAATSFSHALSTHKAENEIDFFAALDDAKSSEDSAGSAHIGDLQFNSATYYRYIKLDVGQLVRNLYGNPDHLDMAHLQGVIDSFVKALYLAIPSARQNSQSASCPWDYAKIFVRQGQGIQLNLDQPVRLTGHDKESGYSVKSIDYLNKFLADKQKTAGSLFGKKLEIEVGQGSDLSIDDVSAQLSKQIGEFYAR